MTKELNYIKLRTEVEHSKHTKVDLAKNCGISRVTLDRALGGKEIGLSKFLKLVGQLDKPVGYFFDEDVDIREVDMPGERAQYFEKVDEYDGREQRTASKEESGINVQLLQMRIESMEEKVAERDRLIAEKDERIKELKERIEELKARD